jgi:hypothetical protein
MKHTTGVQTSPLTRIGDLVALSRMVWQYLERDKPKTPQAAHWNHNT